MSFSFFFVISCSRANVSICRPFYWWNRKFRALLVWGQWLVCINHNTSGSLFWFRFILILRFLLAPFWFDINLNDVVRFFCFCFCFWLRLWGLLLLCRIFPIFFTDLLEPGLLPFPVEENSSCSRLVQSDSTKYASIIAQDDLFWPFLMNHESFDAVPDFGS